MTNYRAFNAVAVTTGQTGSLDNAWGILRNSSGAGTVYLEGYAGTYRNSGSVQYATMSVADIAAGQPFPCYVRKVEVSAGTVYLLA